MNSFSPHLYNEWDTNINKKTLNEYSLNSKFLAAWVCSVNSNHKWNARISHRSNGTRCPYCTNKKLLVGDNDLASRFPNLVKEWSSKNSNTPDEVVFGSAKKVNWVCSKGHEWEDSISNRTLLGRGCPYCNGAKPLVGVNDFATLYPELLKEWSPKNSLDPTQLLPKANKKVFWICVEGHEWETVLARRTHSKTGCPVCVNQKVITGYNDFATKYPNHPILKEWSPNNELEPTQIVAGSNRKILWVGDCGHEWEASLAGRIRNNYSCPYCTHKKLLEGFNDLATTHPELAIQLSDKNNFSATEILGAQDEKVWWLGECGHEWEANIYKRKSGQNCPICAHKQLLEGFNDLATTHPELAIQLSDKNNFSATEIIGAGDKKVWWKCNNGHEWQAVVYSRKRGNGCPYCNVTVSAAELEIRDFLEQFNFDVKYNDRKVLNGLELDFYIPEKNIAIEFNGLYWHTESQGKDKNYHYNKWLECKKQSIQLIQVWEDDWSRNPKLIKNMLANKLGVNVQEKIYARNTSIVEISYTDAQDFMMINHIQGWVQGSYYIGLRNNDNELVALCILKKEPKTNGKTLNLLRYATSMKVVGGFTKILKYVEKTYMPEKIITFSDNTISDGGLYKNNGFTVDKQIKPDYQYYADGERKHKFGYRLKRFKNDNNLIWVDGLTEKELAITNGLERVWDAGKIRWVKQY